MNNRPNAGEIHPELAAVFSGDGTIKDLLESKMTGYAKEYRDRHGMKLRDISLLADALSELGVSINVIPDEALEELGDIEASIEQRYLGHLQEEDEEE